MEEQALLEYMHYSMLLRDFHDYSIMRRNEILNIEDEQEREEAFQVMDATLTFQAVDILKRQAILHKIINKNPFYRMYLQYLKHVTIVKEQETKNDEVQFYIAKPTTRIFETATDDLYKEEYKDVFKDGVELISQLDEINLKNAKEYKERIEQSKKSRFKIVK